VAPSGEGLVELSPEFWRDRLLRPVRMRGRAWIRGLSVSGAGSEARPLRLEARGTTELGPAGGFKLLLDRGGARLFGPDGMRPMSISSSGVTVELGSRRLILDGSSIRFERYDPGEGAWVEQASADLLESWRDAEKPGKISMEALKSYPIGPADLAVPGLDGQGRLVLTEVGAKASSLDALASQRAWGQKALVVSSDEISEDGLIRPGSVTVPKIAPDVGVKSDLVREEVDATYSTISPDYVLAEEVKMRCQSAIKNVLEEAYCKLKVFHGDGLGRAWCKVAVKAGDGPEQDYAEWSTTNTSWTAFSRASEIMGGEGEEIATRFYMRLEVVEPPPVGGELPKAYMRSPGLRGRRYAIRLEVP